MGHCTQEATMFSYVDLSDFEQVVGRCVDQKGAR